MDCNLCGGSEFRMLFSSEEYPDRRKGNVYECVKCGLITRYTYPVADSILKEQSKTN